MSHLGAHPELPHVLQLGLVQHPAVAQLLQTHVLRPSSSPSGVPDWTLLQQQLELLLAPAQSCSQRLGQDTTVSGTSRDQPLQIKAPPTVVTDGGALTHTLTQQYMEDTRTPA